MHLLNIELEATVVSIVNFIFLALFLVAGFKQMKKNPSSRID